MAKVFKEEDELELFNIDETNIDEEWIKQPRRYANFARKLAKARLDLDQHKANVDVIEAEIAADVRKRPRKYGLKEDEKGNVKITEAMVKEKTILDDRYQTAIQESLNKAYRVRVLEGYVTALDHRKKALENYVYLIVNAFKADPRAPEGTRELAEYWKKKAARRT